jgi:hypothetical protein
VTELSLVALALLSVSVLAFGHTSLRSRFRRAKLEPSFEPSVPAQLGPRFSMAQFNQIARDKTRAQILDQYGPPDEVTDYGDSWLYYNLDVYDDDLGNHLTVRIRFAGIDGPMDFVAVVEFW